MLIRSPIHGRLTPAPDHSGWNIYRTSMLRDPKFIGNAPTLDSARRIAWLLGGNQIQHGLSPEYADIK